MSQNNNVIGWFDMPVNDLNRAVEFYTTVLDNKVHLEKAGEFEFAVFDHNEGIGGCLVPTATQIPSENTILVYFNVDCRIRDAVLKAKQLGATILEDIHAIGPYGFRALIIDSEGNRVALHSTVDQ